MPSIIVGLGLALVVGEAAARAYAHMGSDTGKRIASRDPLATVYEPFGNFGLSTTSRQRNEGGLQSCRLSRATAVGFGVNDDETIDARMRRLLTEYMPSGCVDVVNLAVGGHHATRPSGFRGLGS